MTERAKILEICTNYDIQGKYEQAMQVASDAIATYPKEIGFWLFRGKLLADRLGKVAEAIDDFKAASTLEPNSAIPHQHLSLCYLLLNDLDTATFHAEEAVELASADAMSNSCLARCRLRSKRFNAAVKYFENAVAVDEKSSGDLTGLGESYRGIGNLEKAENAYERAVALAPTPNHYIQLGALKLDLGKKEEAIEVFELAQQLELTEVENELVLGYLSLVKQT